MSVFKYKTYDNSGNLVAGIIDADSQTHAASKLKGRGLFPFEINRERVAGDRPEEKSERRKRIKKAEITGFTRQLSTLTTSGMPIVESLTALSEQTANSSLRKIIVAVKESVSSGLSLSEALAGYARYFSPVYVNLVRAGESGGNLDSILEELADLGEKQEAIKGKVMAAMAYPFFMTIVGVIVLAVLFVLVIPKIISIFDNMGQSLPIPTKILIGVTYLVQNYWLLILVLLILALVFFVKAKKTKKGKMFIDGLILKLPLAGEVFCKIEVSRFSRTLSLLLKGGVPITQALDITKDVLNNSLIARNVAEARENLSEGGDISSILKEGGFFPPVAVHMIAVGERGGKLEEMLLNVANSFDREIENLSSGLASIVEPLLIIVMGIVVGFIALAVLLPIFEMNMLVG